MIRNFVIFCFFSLWIFSPLGANESIVITTDEPVAIKEKGFLITPPKGWEIHRKSQGSSLLFQVPHSPEMIYQRTIQVMSFDGYQFMDEITANEFGKIITDKFSSSSSAIQDYRLRSHLPVDMKDGTQGILYYTEFSIDNVPLMQLHILVSSASYHFLMSFTDLAEHFEQSDSVILETAFNAMTSATLDSRPPTRFNYPIIIGVGLGTFLLFVLGFRWRKSRRVVMLGEEFEDYDHITVDDEIENSKPPKSEEFHLNKAD